MNKLWIQFVLTKEDARSFNLPLEQRLPLAQGLELLTRVEQELLAQDEVLALNYQIYYEEDQELPVLDYPLELPLLPEETLVEVLQAPVLGAEEADQAAVQEFLTRFKRSLPKATQLKKSPVPKPKKPINPNTTSAPGRTPWLTVIKKKGFLIGSGMTLVLILGITIGFFWWQPQASKPQAEKAADFTTLMAEGNVQEALKHYPEKEREMIERLYQEEKTDTLQTLAAESKTNLAAFYLAFLQADWQKVTTLPNVPEDTTTQAMKGYAFLQQGKLAEAQLINQELKNETLTQQIQAYQKQQAYQAIHDQRIAQAEQLNQTIRDQKLTEDIKVAQSIVNLLQKYQADQQNNKLSETERKEAQANYELWQSNLQQVGVEQTPAGTTSTK